MTDGATRNRREAVNEGLEKAALWHEERAKQYDYLSGYADNGVYWVKAARTNRDSAAAIRALKEE